MAPITTDNCEFECATSSNNTNNFENDIDIDNFASSNASRRSNEQSNEFDLNQVQVAAEAEHDEQQTAEQEQQQMPWEAPGKQGLYDPQNEHEACGVGFIVAIDGKRSHKVSLQIFPIYLFSHYNKILFYPLFPFGQILRDAQTLSERMNHRGACACDNDTGDGAGVLASIPHGLYAKAL